MELSQNQIFVLALLSNQDYHGYAMIKAIKEQFNKAILLGSLYNTLRALEEKGLVDHLFKNDEKDRERKYYRITGEGSTQLNLNLLQYHQLSLNLGIA